MTSSLVGSEMCIRDSRVTAVAAAATSYGTAIMSRHLSAEGAPPAARRWTLPRCVGPSVSTGQHASARKVAASCSVMRSSSNVLG
eukprot:375963-Prorocentrum_lima.AAC.1